MNGSNRSGSAGFKWAFGPNLYNLQLVGLWRTASDCTADRIFSNIRLNLILFIVTFACIFPCYQALKKVWGNLTLMVDNLQFTLPLTASAMKLFAMWSKREVFTIMNGMVLADWLKTKTEKERKVMKKWARIARIITITSNCVTYAAIVWLIIVPWFGWSVKNETEINGIDRRFSVHSYFIHDMSKTPVFVITYLLHTFGVIMCAISYTGIDNHLIILIFHICGQFHNLNEQILNLHEFQHFRHALAYCVQEHVRLLRFIDTIDNSFAMMLFALLLHFAVLFCFNSFIAINQVNGELPLGQLILTMLSVSITCGHMCLFCVIGEILIFQTESIYYTTYDYKWYMLKSQDAKSLMHLMIHASKSKHITAGKLFPMTMATFCSFLKTSAGYISILFANQN